MALNNQANRHSEVGDRAGALAAIDEAVTLYRALAGANIWINFVGKGGNCDLYPLAQAFWIACSVVVVIVLARRPSMKRLAWGLFGVWVAVTA